MYIRLYTVHIQNTCDHEDQNKTLFSHNKVEIENTTKDYISNKKKAFSRLHSSMQKLNG